MEPLVLAFNKGNYQMMAYNRSIRTAPPTIALIV